MLNSFLMELQLGLSETPYVSLTTSDIGLYLTSLGGSLGIPQFIDVRACLELINVESNDEKTADFAVTDGCTSGNST